MSAAHVAEVVGDVPDAVRPMERELRIAGESRGVSHPTKGRGGDVVERVVLGIQLSKARQAYLGALVLGECLVILEIATLKTAIDAPGELVHSVGRNDRCDVNDRSVTRDGVTHECLRPIGRYAGE